MLQFILQRSASRRARDLAYNTQKLIDHTEGYKKLQSSFTNIAKRCNQHYDIKDRLQGTNLTINNIFGIKPIVIIAITAWRIRQKISRCSCKAIFSTKISAFGWGYYSVTKMTPHLPHKPTPSAILSPPVLVLATSLNPLSTQGPLHALNWWGLQEPS